VARRQHVCGQMRIKSGVSAVQQRRATSVGTVIVREVEDALRVALAYNAGASSASWVLLKGKVLPIPTRVRFS
jgi:hypothetical protein